MTGQENRGTILLEDAEVIEQFDWPEEQYIVRLRSPRVAAAAQAGSFVHLTCDNAIPMRRPLSIMRVDAEAGWLDILYKIHGEGLRALADQRPGELLSCLGPIGKPFEPRPERPHRVLIGGGVGIPPLVFLAEALAGDSSGRTVAFMGSEIPFPFDLGSATDALPGIDATVDATMQLLDDHAIPSRLASLAGFDGVYNGYVTELASDYLAALPADELAKCEIFSCGPTPMLKATAAVARKFNLPCQVSLEEYMACAVGGCAGCTVPVTIDGTVAMKRVCVDGPVFEAQTVFPASG
ncbi:MAG: dihydroorotate dehydrogenase electron transfer subunit [Pseudomonadota bacterium]